jgi:hypothetical protein
MTHRFHAPPVLIAYGYLKRPEYFLKGGEKRRCTSDFFKEEDPEDQFSNDSKTLPGFTMTSLKPVYIYIKEHERTFTWTFLDPVSFS